jgi:hypothetical protein
MFNRSYFTIGQYDAKSHISLNAGCKVHLLIRVLQCEYELTFWRLVLSSL